MKIALFALAVGVLPGVVPCSADAGESSGLPASNEFWEKIAGTEGADLLADGLSAGEFVMSQSAGKKSKEPTSTDAADEAQGDVRGSDEEDAANGTGGSSKEDGPEDPSVAPLRRPLQFEFVTQEGNRVEGLSYDQLQIDRACTLLNAKDDLELLDKLATCIKPAAIGNYLISGTAKFLASPDLVRFVIPVAISRFKTVHLEASMKDGSTIPVNCSPQISLSAENGFETVFPLIEDVSDDRRTLRYKVELPKYLPVSSSTLKIETSRSSGCRLAEANLGLERGKAVGRATLDEMGATFSAQFVPSDPALLVVLTRGSAVAADGRLAKEWKKQASALLEAAFEAARQSFSQVIVAGYTGDAEYTVFLRVPKTQFREHLKRIKNDNDFGFKMESAAEGLDSSLQVDLEQQIAELASQGVSVLTVVYGRQQPEGELCDFGALANNQFLERLGQSLIVDVLPTKTYNAAIKTVRANERASEVVIVKPVSENFSSIDCVKYAGLIENRELSRLTSAFALPLLRADEDLSADYLELSRNWIGGLLETAQ